MHSPPPPTGSRSASREVRAENVGITEFYRAALGGSERKGLLTARVPVSKRQNRARPNADLGFRPVPPGSSLGGGAFHAARRHLQNLRALADNQTCDEYYSSIGKFQRVMVQVRPVHIDLPKMGQSFMLRRSSLPSNRAH